LNDKYLRLLEERKRLADMSHKPVYDERMETALHERMETLQKTLDQRHEDMSQVLTPVDTVRIMDTMNKLKEALCELTTRNADLVNATTDSRSSYLSCHPRCMKKFMQAKRSHSEIYSEQRTDPHHLVPERPTEFAFERANPNDKRLSLLQRCAAYHSVTDLLEETSDLTHLMSTVHSSTEVDMNDNGNNADSAGDNPPISAQEAHNVQEISNGDDAIKRNHDSIVHEGHKVHSSKVQRMNPTPNFPNEVFQSNPDPMYQNNMVDNAYMQVNAFPVTEQQTAFVQSAHFGEP
jgi:hypothetical protein